ncbi:MAG: hypothetical protein Kow0091_04040 [Geminocystis sp.]
MVGKTVLNKLGVVMKDSNNLEQIRNKANKNRWIAGVLTFFVAPVGYFYTLRYKAALISFIVYIILVGASEENETMETLLGFFAISVTVENVISINKAKNKFKELEGNTNQLTNYPSSFSGNSPDIIILKAINNRGEMTVSEIVIATELSPQIVKKTLLDLENEHLIYGYNRESDGAVVYKNI